jgi:hypothetical protein
MNSEHDQELQNLFEGCNVSLVYSFCNYFNISHKFYEDETGIRFFLYHDETPEIYDLSYFSPDNGFTYYVYYNAYRDELIRKFSKFKKLKAFL